MIQEFAGYITISAKRALVEGLDAFQRAELERILIQEAAIAPDASARSYYEWLLMTARALISGKEDAIAAASERGLWLGFLQSVPTVKYELERFLTVAIAGGGVLGIPIIIAGAKWLLGFLEASKLSGDRRVEAFAKLSEDADRLNRQGIKFEVPSNIFVLREPIQASSGRTWLNYSIGMQAASDLSKCGCHLLAAAAAAATSFDLLTRGATKLTVATAETARALLSRAIPVSADHAALLFHQSQLEEDFGQKLAHADEGIEILEGLIARHDPDSPSEWRHALASSYTDRGRIRMLARGYGLAASLQDHDASIKLREKLLIDLGDDCPKRWRADLADAYVQRSGVARKVTGRGSKPALEDCKKAIGILEPLGAGPFDDLNWWGVGLAIAYLTQAGLQLEEECRDLEASIVNYNNGIESLRKLVDAQGDACQLSWKTYLAIAYGNRAAMRTAHLKESADIVLDDHDSCVAVFESATAQLNEKEEERPPEWDHAMAKAYFNRGNCRYAALGAAAAICDYRAALAIHSTPKARVLARNEWLLSYVRLAECLIETGDLPGALGVIIEAGEARIESVGAAFLAEEQKEMLAAGAEIAAWGAWLHVKLGNAGAALEFFEAQSGLLLKEAVIRDPQMLATYVGQQRADAIAGLQSRIHELRHILAGGHQIQDAEALGGELRSLSEEFRAAAMDLDAGAYGQRLTVREMAKLAPEGGVIVVPAVTRFGAVLMALGRNGQAVAHPLPKLTREIETDWANRLLHGEGQCSRVFGNKRASRPERMNAITTFDRLLRAEAGIYWRDLVGPLYEFLESLGFEKSAAITLVTSGPLDLLPLHIASRTENGAVRHAIEDRVFRYAPGLRALKLMAERSAAYADATPHMIGFFAPQREDQDPVDLPGVLGPELRALKDIEGLKVTAHTKSSATRTRLLDLMRSAAKGPIFTDLHLSMHADFNLARPELSAIYFVDENGERVKVTVSDVWRLRPVNGLRHVCLSSCQSGRSDPLQMPGEAVGLVGAFIQAGAASLLSALYSILDHSAAEIVPAIYRRRMQGKDVAEALRDEICARLDADTQAPEGSEQSGPVSPDPDERAFDTTRYLQRGRSLSLIDWAAFKPTCA